jgi:tetratricopeptide (TPR) repeat protein
MTLARAGERASSLGASTEAATLFARAAELAEGAVQEAVYRRLAGNATAASGRLDEGAEQLARAIDLLEEAGETHMAARASADLGLVEFQSGRLDQAIERMERAFAVLGHEEPDEDLAFLAMQLGRFHWFVGNDELSRARNQLALDAAERLRLIEVIAHALSTAGLLASRRRHWETALALIGRSLELGLEHGLPHVIFRGYANLAAPLTRLGNYAEAEEYSRRGVELARKIGDRAAEQFHIGNLASYCLERGRWDDVVELDEQRPAGLDVPSLGLDVAVAAVARHRGDPAAAGSVAERIAALEHSASIQDRVTVAETRFHALMAAGDAEGALETLERAGDEVLDDVSVRLHLAEAASAVGRMDRVAEILAGIDALGPAGAHPVERARTARYRAALAATEGDHERAEVSFKSAAAALREYDALPQLAFVEVEHAEGLTAIGRGEEAGPLLAEAREILARLRARPWLERLAKLDGLGVEEPALVLESG